MKKRVALVRGPNLNSWEMQNFVPLKESFDITAISSYLPEYSLNNEELPVRKLFSWGQLARARVLRRLLRSWLGDFHDLQGLGRALEGFDLVHAAETQYYFSYQAARVKRSLGFKFVLSVWENIPFLLNNAAARHNREVVFREADLILAVSQRTKETLMLEGANPGKIRVQPPGIDTDNFRPMSRDVGLLSRLGCSEEDFVILMIARLVKQKGLYDLVFAVRRLIERLRNKRTVKLLIGGTGPEEKHIRKMISQLGLQNNVRMIGSHSYQSMTAIHNLADVFVLPSQPTPVWQEQFGYVLLESMACGKPVISTLSGSIPEVVGDAGLLVPPSDFSSLANSLEEIFNANELRTELGRRGRARACEMFDLRKIAGQFQTHYESLIGL
ncbi:MAG TPA: glycosyl transferase family 1 [Bacteroidetes bacterium]|jgi:alpha-maltose-1-phosphate synthase|nr:glycosyl transferase family 1 [Bacteroidota bacterium]